MRCSVLCGALAAVVAAGALMPSAQAADAPRSTGPRVYGLIDRTTPHHRALTARRITVPEAVVSRALSEQPVWPHLAEVRVVHQIIYVDPLVEYEDLGWGGLDENHSILKAQRLHRGLNANTAPRLFTNPAAGSDAQTEAAPRPMIIFTPAFPPARQSPDAPAPAPGSPGSPGSPAPGESDQPDQARPQPPAPVALAQPADPAPAAE